MNTLAIYGNNRGSLARISESLLSRVTGLADRLDVEPMTELRNRLHERRSGIPIFIMSPNDDAAAWEWAFSFSFECTTVIIFGDACDEENARRCKVLFVERGAPDSLEKLAQAVEKAILFSSTHGMYHNLRNTPGFARIAQYLRPCLDLAASP